MQKTNKLMTYMIIVFIFPVIISWILYHYHDHFHLKTLNHGILVSPPIDAQALYAPTREKKWRIIYVAGAQCDQACQQIYHQLQQVKKALGKDADRVRTLQLNDTFAALNILPAAFAKQDKKDFAVSNKIYLIDPLGNLFMYYPSDINPMAVLKDLKRVLEVSQIG